MTKFTRVLRTKPTEKHADVFTLSVYERCKRYPKLVEEIEGEIEGILELSKQISDQLALLSYQLELEINSKEYLLVDKILKKMSYDTNLKNLKQLDEEIVDSRKRGLTTRLARQEKLKKGFQKAIHNHHQEMFGFKGQLQ